MMIWRRYLATSSANQAPHQMIDIYQSQTSRVPGWIRLLSNTALVVFPSAVYLHLSYRRQVESNSEISFPQRQWQSILDLYTSASHRLFGRLDKHDKQYSYKKTSQSHVYLMTLGALTATGMGAFLASFFTTGYIARIRINSAYLEKYPSLSQLLLKQRNKGSAPPEPFEYVLNASTEQPLLEPLRQIPLEITYLNRWGWFKTRQDLTFANFEKCRSGMGRGKHLYANLVRLDHAGKYKQYHILELDDLRLQAPKFFVALHSIIPWTQPHMQPVK